MRNSINGKTRERGIDTKGHKGAFWDRNVLWTDYGGNKILHICQNLPHCVKNYEGSEIWSYLQVNKVNLLVSWIPAEDTTLLSQIHMILLLIPGTPVRINSIFLCQLPKPQFTGHCEESHEHLYMQRDVFQERKTKPTGSLSFFFFAIFYFWILFCFSFIFISWRLITLQYCSGFCHTLTWISHGFTCIPHPYPPSRLLLHPIPLGLPSAPGPSTCLMHPAWAGDLFHPR